LECNILERTKVVDFQSACGGWGFSFASSKIPPASATAFDQLVYSGLLPWQ